MNVANGYANAVREKRQWISDLTNVSASLRKSAWHSSNLRQWRNRSVYASCAPEDPEAFHIFFEVKADDRGRTKIKDHELLVIFQDRSYDTTAARRRNSVEENDDLQKFQDCLDPQEGMNLSIEFFRMKNWCRIYTNRQEQRNSDE